MILRYLSQLTFGSALLWLQISTIRLRLDSTLKHPRFPTMSLKDNLKPHPCTAKQQLYIYNLSFNSCLTAVKFIGSIGFQAIELVLVCNQKKIQVRLAMNNCQITKVLREITCSVLLKRRIRKSLKSHTKIGQVITIIKNIKKKEKEEIPSGVNLTIFKPLKKALDLYPSSLISVYQNNLSLHFTHLK